MIKGAHFADGAIVKSLEEIKAAVGDPAPNPSGGGPNFASFTEVVYKELTNR